MIPHTYPTTRDGAGESRMRVSFLASVTGLTRWVDYIPVKTVAWTTADKGTTNANGFMPMERVATTTGLRAFADYVPVYEDAAATLPHNSGPSGYIPVCEVLSLDFLGGTLDSRVTFTRADATSCATWFDSTGRLQTAAANVARFDYDPATPLGVTGGELVTGIWGTINGTVIASSTSSSFVATPANTAEERVYNDMATTVGKTYSITFRRLSSSTTPVYVRAGSSGAGTILVNQPTGVGGTYTVSFVAQTTTTSVLYTNAQGQAFSFDNISVKEVTFTPRGLLIEESRTNLLLQSRDMTNAAWTKTDVTPTRNQVGIDGVANTACLMTEGSAGTAIASQDSAAVTAGSTVTVSKVLKRGNTDWMRLGAFGGGFVNGTNAWFNLATGAKGTVGAVGAATAATSTIQSLGGGWYRCTVTCIPDGTYTVPKAYVMSASADGSATRVANATYIVDCAQLEVGAFATSIITTAAATVTRAADSASMTGTNFSSWFNASAGTFVAEADLQQKAVQQSVVTADDTTINNRVEVAVNSAWKGRLQVVSGGVTQADVNSVGAVISANTPYKIAATYSASDFQMCLGASLGTGVLSGTVPAVTRLVIGTRSDGATQYNGHIRRLSYYPSRLPNATLQALTA